MGGYVQKTRAAAKPPASADAHGIDARSAASGHSATPDGSAAQSPPRSLLQLRQALDGSPRVQQHAALQRALDQRAAAPAKKKSKEKPALQMKGIAINDDIALEKEADLQGRKALTGAATTGRTQAPAQLQAVIQFEKFIGDASRIHLHIEISSPHLKIGNDKYDLAGGGGYENKRIEDALAALTETMKGRRRYANVSGYTACLNWLCEKLGKNPADYKDEKDDKKGRQQRS